MGEEGRGKSYKAGRKWPQRKRSYRKSSHLLGTTWKKLTFSKLKGGSGLRGGEAEFRPGSKTPSVSQNPQKSSKLELATLDSIHGLIGVIHNSTHLQFG